jgi:DNA-binding MltR family transcriptional regulator
VSRGRRKQTLRDFTREFPSKEDNQRFREAMNSPSDMVTAIVHAIEVEYLLEQLIIAKLKRKDDVTVELLSKDNGPLATFFSKIILGYAIGLFDEISMEYLNTIRRIRNAFAHSRKEISFSTALIRGEMSSLKLPTNKRSALFRQISLVKRLCLANPTPSPDDKDPQALIGRAAYVILCMAFAAIFMKRQALSARARHRRFSQFNRGRLASDTIDASIVEKNAKDAE